MIASQAKFSQPYLQKIEQYEAEHNCIIAYGGDGTVLRAVQAAKPGQYIIPIRDYGRCKMHNNVLDDLLDGKLDRFLSKTECYYIDWSANSSTLADYFFGRGIAEVAIKNVDPTEALRFNVLVDGKLYMKNVIADGVVLSTRYGSTGYFKSVARCIFNTNAIGIAFIAPTQGINNLVLDSNSKIRFELARNACVVVTSDKQTKTAQAHEGMCIDACISGQESICICGLDIFHCQDCRTLRHSALENGDIVQDQYAK